MKHAQFLLSFFSTDEVTEQGRHRHCSLYLQHVIRQLHQQISKSDYNLPPTPTPTATATHHHRRFHSVSLDFWNLEFCIR
jgi:hypothetical protein